MRMFKRVLIGVLFICSVLMLNTKDGLCSGDISGNSGSTQNGGNMHHVGGRKTSQSSPFDYGIRFSLVNNTGGYDGKIIGRTVDLFHLKNWGNKSFGNKDLEIIHSKHGTSKVEYLRGKKKLDLHDEHYLSKDGGYAKWYKDIWKVYGSGMARKSHKKKWLTEKKNAKVLMKYMNVTKSQFYNRNNYLVVEPIFYFYMEGKYYGLTATEIGLFDYLMENKNGVGLGKYKSNRSIKSHQGGRSHSAIPAADYLQIDKWGIEKPTAMQKRRGYRYSNSEIINKMGISIFRFLKPDTPPPDPVIENVDYIYRCDTDVFTSVELTMKSEANPNNPLSVDFNIPGVGTVTASGIYCPKGYKQLVWVQWHTPKQPCDMNIRVSSNIGGSATIKARVEENTQWEPHNPVADDERPIDLDEFQMNISPDKSKYAKIKEKKKTIWSRWEIVEYHPRGDFRYWKEIKHYSTDSDGHSYYDYSTYEAIWDENPYFSFGQHEYTTNTAPDGSSVTHVVNGRTPSEPTYYTAQLKKIEMKIKPAQTCKRENPDERFIKSGYGIEADIESSIYSNESSNVTGFQTSKYLFPEFNYKKYWRLGDKTERKNIRGTIKEKMQLPKNYYSYTGYFGYSDGRYHFLPIWYPDGNYKVYAKIYDCWTPAGELRAKVTADIICKGAMWDDWHVQIVK